jgi:hypothetical protein
VNGDEVAQVLDDVAAGTSELHAVLLDLRRGE